MLPLATDRQYQIYQLFKMGQKFTISLKPTDKVSILLILFKTGGCHGSPKR